jgi:hypothetical protein
MQPTYIIPQMIYMSMEPQRNYTDRGKLKDSEKDLSQCHFIHHISHRD